MDSESLIEIRDTGIGIPEERQRMLFSSIVKSSPGTDSEKGKGLGLMLSQEFTVAQGGRIWLKSEINKGSTFYLAFPLVT